MPFKANADRRHHIPKQQRRVTNWAEYDAALRQRGSLAVWFSEEAIAAWHAEPRTTPGGQPHYSDLGITTALTLKAVFRFGSAPERRPDRLGHSPAGSRSLCSRPYHPEPPGGDLGDAAAAAGQRCGARSSAGGQHGSEALRARGMADREAWHEKAPVLENAPHRHGC